MVHVSDISWTKRIKHPSEALKKGDKVEALILSIDGDNRRLSLGIKQLTPDAWESFFERYRVGDVVRGKVVRTASFGAFVELEPGIEGLCHVSEASGDKDQRGVGRRAPAPAEAPSFEVGQEMAFKIIKLSPLEHKIGLSLRAVGQEIERQELDSYLQQQRAGGANFYVRRNDELEDRSSDTDETSI